MKNNSVEPAELVCTAENAEGVRADIAERYSDIRNKLERQNNLVSYLDFCTITTAEPSQIAAHNKAIIDLLDDVMFEMSELTDITKAYLDYKLSLCAIPEEVTEENTEETT